MSDEIDYQTQVGGGDAVAHGEGDDIDDLLGVDRQQCRTEDEVGVRVDDEFHDAAGLLDGVGAGHREDVGDVLSGHREVRPSARACFSVRPAVANGGVMNSVRGTATRSAVVRLPSPSS